MSACLLQMFVNKLNAYEPGLVEKFVAPDVQAHLDRVEREKFVKDMYLKWLSAEIFCLNEIEQEMAVYDIAPLTREQICEKYDVDLR